MNGEMISVEKLKQMLELARICETNEVPLSARFLLLRSPGMTDQEWYDTVYDEATVEHMKKVWQEIK